MSVSEVSSNITVSSISNFPVSSVSCSFKKILIVALIILFGSAIILTPISYFVIKSPYLFYSTLSLSGLGCLIAGCYILKKIKECSSGVSGHCYTPNFINCYGPAEENVRNAITTSVFDEILFAGHTSASGYTLFDCDGVLSGHRNSTAQRRIIIVYNSSEQQESVLSGHADTLARQNKDFLDENQGVMVILSFKDYMALEGGSIPSWLCKLLKKGNYPGTSSSVHDNLFCNTLSSGSKIFYTTAH